MSGFKALALGAAVNFFDPRNPARDERALWNYTTTTQDFTIAVTDADGREATVSRRRPALRQRGCTRTTGNITPRVHIILNQIRVPLADFAAQGVDLTKLRKLELRFGETGKPATGSVELADVRFQEAADGSAVLADGPRATAKSADVQPIDLIEQTPRTTVAAAGQAVALVPAATTKSVCADTIAPTAKITAKGKRVIRGTATDTGCGAKVASV